VCPALPGHDATISTDCEKLRRFGVGPPVSGQTRYCNTPFLLLPTAAPRYARRSIVLSRSLYQDRRVQGRDRRWPCGRSSRFRTATLYLGVPCPARSPRLKIVYLRVHVNIVFLTGYVTCHKAANLVFPCPCLLVYQSMINSDRIQSCVFTLFLTAWHHLTFANYRLPAGSRLAD